MTHHIPDASSALGCDALYVLANVIKRAGSLDRKAIRDQIRIQP